MALTDKNPEENAGLIHVLVPSHRLLSDEEKEELLNRLNIKLKNLPFIHLKDPAIKGLGGKVGDVVEIKRKSVTAGESIYYRVIVE